MKDRARKIAESYFDHKASPFEADLCRKLARELRGIFKGQWHSVRYDPPTTNGVYIGARWTDAYENWELGVARFNPEWADRWDNFYELWAEIPSLPKKKQ